MKYLYYIIQEVEQKKRSSRAVTLNAPENNNISYSGSVTYNCSVNVTGGATATNITLYNNISGSWEANGTINLGTIIYDEINDSSINASLWIPH